MCVLDLFLAPVYQVFLGDVLVNGANWPSLKNQQGDIQRTNRI